MDYVERDSIRIIPGSGGPSAPLVYAIDAVEHPFAEIDAAAQGLRANVAVVPVRDWNDALTPWAAPALRRGAPDFGGQAARTYGELAELALDGFEAAHGLSPIARGIAGYSLGGLFALWAWSESLVFDGAASLSGSLWYDGWVDYLRKSSSLRTSGFAYLSLGKKERKAPHAVMRRVGTCLQDTADILRARGCTVVTAEGPGGHFHFVRERWTAGLAALDRHLG